jgi:hypothetical protein
LKILFLDLKSQMAHPQVLQSGLQKASGAKIAAKSSRIDLLEEVFAVWDRNAVRTAIPVR